MGRQARSLCARSEPYRRCQAPDYADGWGQLGNALDNLRLDQESLDAYERAHSLAPEQPYICNNLAGAYESAGRLGDAARLYAERIRLSPGDAFNAHVSLGIINWRRRLRDEARSHFDSALAIWDIAWERGLQSPASLLENKALALVGLGRKAEAVAALQDGLGQLRPDDTLGLERYDALASDPPDGLSELRGLIDEAQRSRQV